jgi:dTDP-4-dehydrorhamnose reductase
MKILLAGANGQVGREIQDIGLPDGMQLVALNRLELDITDAEQIHCAIKKYTPNVIINAAAYTLVDKAEQDSLNAFAINGEGPANLAKACQQLDIPLIHISTDYVFDGTKNQPYLEDDSSSPINIYGQSKWQGEENVRKYASKHIILRTSWVFGFYGNNFVKTVLRIAQKESVANIVHDQQGAPTYAGDIAHAIIEIIKRINGKEKLETLWGTYHYTNFPAVSWYEFAKEIVSAIPSAIPVSLKEIKPITTSEYPTPAKRPLYSVLHCQKITNVFGIIQYDWQSTLNYLMEEIANEHSAK